MTTAHAQLTVGTILADGGQVLAFDRSLRWSNAMVVLTMMDGIFQTFLLSDIGYSPLFHRTFESLSDAAIDFEARSKNS